LACNYLAARNAHFGVSDSTLLFTLCLALYGLVRAVAEGPAFLPLAGAAVGMGFGIKYSARPWIVPRFVAVGICFARFTARRTLVFGFLSVLAAVLAFGLASPDALPHFVFFVKQLTQHFSRYDSDAHGYLIDSNFAVPPGWRFYLAEDL